MPKIKTYSKSIAGVTQEIKVWYTEKNGFHVKEFPEQVLSVVGDHLNHLSGKDDLATLEQQINKIVIEYEKLIRTRKKVIYLKTVIGHETFMRIGAENVNVQRNKKGHSVSYNVNPEYKKVDSDFGDHTLDFGFCFSFEMGYEYTEGDKKYYTVLDSNWASVTVNAQRFPGEYKFYIDDHIVLEWTQKREDYFRKLAEQLDSAAEAFAEFFRDTDKTAKRIDTNKSVFLLPEK